MEYHSPKIPEGINTSDTHPLVDVAWMLGTVLAILLLVILVLTLLSDRIAARIPFGVEQRLVENRLDPVVEIPLQRYLQGLADRVVAVSELPEGMSITVRYSDSDMVNAYATLGGNLVFFRGLLEKLSSENALMMVMAHEIAHIRHRDPIRSMGRGVVVGLSLAVVSTAAGSAVVEHFLGSTGYLAALRFSRAQERAADRFALDACRALYGHLAGADELFLVLEQMDGRGVPIEFLATHPLTQSRLQEIAWARAGETEGVLTALPAGFSDWLEKPTAQPASR